MLVAKSSDIIHHPWLAIKDCAPLIVSLSRRYILVNDPAHRLFALVSALLFVLVTCLFTAYAFVEKMHLTQNFLYGQVKFSFVDWGYPESLGYAFTLMAAVFFLRFAMGTGNKHWLAWSAICIVIFLDDSMQFHETIGASLVTTEGISAGVSELMGFALMGSLIGVFWLAGLWFSPKRKADVISYLLFSVYLALLIFAGVGIDFLHDVLKTHFSVSETIMALLEDGSELALQMVLAISAFGMWRLQRQGKKRAN
jgi:hypothetical protein